MNKWGLNRVESEREYYNKKFRSKTLSEKELVVDDGWLNNYHRYHSFALKLLGNIRNKNILNIGCGGVGGGSNNVWLAKKGANVSGVDITEEGLRVAKHLANFNNVSIDIRLESAEDMSFPSDYFDKILSYGCIHHLNIEAGMKELFRCLKPGGTLIVVEPPDKNPFLRFARKYLWYPGDKRTAHERALSENEIKDFSNYFGQSELFYFELFGCITRFLALIPIIFVREILINLFNSIDNIVLKAFPSLRPYCRIFVGKYTKSLDH